MLQGENPLKGKVKNQGLLRKSRRWRKVVISRLLGVVMIVVRTSSGAQSLLASQFFSGNQTRLQDVPSPRKTLSRELLGALEGGAGVVCSLFAVNPRCSRGISPEAEREMNEKKRGIALILNQDDCSSVGTASSREKNAGRGPGSSSSNAIYATVPLESRRYSDPKDSPKASKPVSLMQRA